MKKLPIYTKCYLIGDINGDNLRRLHSDLDDAIASKSKAIILEITSVGGEIDAAMSMVSRITASPVPVITLASGVVASAAVIVFNAGCKRLIRPLTTVLIHPIRMDVEGNKGQHRAEYEQLTRDEALYAKLLANKSRLTVEQIIEFMQKETYLNVEQVITMKLADEVHNVD
jgi:ATP-dependent protease ClpP protease subunit